MNFSGSLVLAIHSITKENLWINYEYKSSDYSDVINNSKFIEMLILNRPRFNDRDKTKNKNYDITMKRKIISIILIKL